ncbi:type III secretion system gatekeeper subunit SctW [Acidovorax sp.]|uniref:type III secretion system gatekeeper subunit SctW n=1 Tax=Acidovorax sp. TaxID=1872122 RepID=UPI002635B092|nr:type III secretion system gatekeeper subunit SctW [Acidovorax sp.]
MSRIESFTPPSFDNMSLRGGLQGGGQAPTGQYAGQQVQVDDGLSVLTDAAEEISLHHSEKAETKHAAERKKEAARPMDLMSPEAIIAYLDAANAHEDPEQLAQLAKRMLSGQGDPAAQAKQAFSGPTEQFMALQYALHQGERDGASAEVLDALREALDDLEMEHGPRMRADVNTIGSAKEGAQGRADVEHFQAAYRDVVLGNPSLAGTLKLALERFGSGDFAAGLARLIQALGQDLAAARPSADPARLQSLVQDLYHLGVAATVLDASRELHARISEQHGALTGTPVVLMQDLVGISAEKWVSGTRFTALADKFGAKGVEAQIHFLTGLKMLTREMPVKVFVDADQRQTVFQAVQDALDAAIDKEGY